MLTRTRTRTDTHKRMCMMRLRPVAYWKFTALACALNETCVGSLLSFCHSHVQLGDRLWIQQCPCVAAHGSRTVFVDSFARGVNHLSEFGYSACVPGGCDAEERP